MTYNQVNARWRRNNIVGIFYTNDPYRDDTALRTSRSAAIAIAKSVVPDVPVMEVNEALAHFNAEKWANAYPQLSVKDDELWRLGKRGSLRAG